MKNFMDEGKLIYDGDSIKLNQEGLFKCLNYLLPFAFTDGKI